jgi:O-methyltransferase
MPEIDTMRFRRRVANFLIKDCGLRNLHNSKTRTLIRAVLDEVDLQHLRDEYPCATFTDRAEMHRHVHDSCIGAGAVDYLEFGVFQGDSIRQWAGLNKNPGSRFFGFDSFEGLPQDWRPGREKGSFNVGGETPQIDDFRVKFIKGWFEETIPPFARDFSVQNRLLLHLDADLYGSTMLALVHLGRFMSPGTLLIFDEFYDRDHEFKALMDWQRIYKKNFKIIAEMNNYGRICAELV